MTSTTTVNLDGSVTVEQWPLEEARAYVWAAVKVIRDAKEHGGCMTPFGPIDTSEAAKLNISGSVQLAMLSIQALAAFETPWTMADNTVAILDAAEMIQVGQLVGQHVAACHAIARDLRQLIEAATTVEELEAIEIDGAAWP